MEQETMTKDIWNELAEKNNAPTWNGLDIETKITILEIHYLGIKEGIKIGYDVAKEATETLNNK